MNIKNLNASAEIKGSVVVTARPRLAAAWRIEPNLAAQVNLGDTSLSVAGARINVPAQVKPVIDKTVADQLAAVQARMRNDPAFEQSARAQWAKACRSIPLQGTGATASMPPLWLELKPIRALAAQPRVDAAAVTLTLGIEAETRITETPTNPNCPFPATITIVPPTPGRVSIGVPIDMSFTDADQARRSAAGRKNLPRGRLGAGRRHGQACERRGLRRPPADFAAGQGEGEEELISASAQRPPSTSGAGRRSTRRSRSCA